ncbi:hypothetical protein [Ureibacillus acetophenoni]|uniref:Uncharacterized protein n=1 Tax=Ureibacillus acetophenoni TaxID=614649 RepID=A0A285UG07_9BACL|nr:hypothetical protein [Ureibacillus acetophenoni]SOC40703.1 hypothetical protein SAMN05877842_108132 [Ureibacillus acetophenoni]
MNLLQVRKGQFVYYNNELHKVYSVKTMFKQSVHLYRLRDMSQHLCFAKDIEKYQPKVSDSFIFNKKRYTLNKDRNAQVGDYILITNPDPDYLDHYSLNEIEVVASVESKGVVTTNSNGIKHSEYLLMVPGRFEYSNPIDYKDKSYSNEEYWDENDLLNDDEFSLSIGDVFKKTDIGLEAMVIAIQGDTVFLGGGFQLHQKELMDYGKWEYLYNILDNNISDE